jgi:hypothetical protein
VSTIESQPSRGSAAGEMPAALLDRIECPLSLSVTAYGVSIGVRTNDPGVIEGLAGHLPPGSERAEFFDTERVYSLVVEEDDRAGRDQHLVYVNDALLARRSTLQASLRAFEADVQLHVAEMAPERIFVHAGVVGYQGRAILLPGRSFAGKSILVRELVRAGAQYYSDEYAVLDSAGGVHPYPRPISIRNERNPGATKLPVDTGCGPAEGGPLPVGLVVMSEFRSGGQWRPRRLSPGRGALAMLANTVAARRIPEVALATLHQVVTRARIVASERGEASSVVEPILALCGASLTEHRG